MSRRYTGKYVVRWMDEAGERQEKTYDSWAISQKAMRWLASAGANEIDMAVEIEEGLKVKKNLIEQEKT